MNTNPTIKADIQEIFKTNFSLFDAYEDDVRKEQIKLITQIEKMAHILEKNIAGVNLFDIFPNNNNILFVDDTKINEVLIAFDRTTYFTEPEIIPEIVEMTDEQKEMIITASKYGITNRRNRLEREIRNCTENATQYMSDYNSQMRSARDRREQLASISDTGNETVVTSLGLLFMDNRFEFLRSSSENHTNDSFEFAIKDDIINTLVNTRAGIDLRVNLGKLKIKVMLASGLGMRVLRHENNISGGNFHPHISSGGEICLGNMGELFNDAADKGDVMGMVNATMQVLLNYNDDDPYRHLSDFVRASQQVQPDGTGGRRRQAPSTSGDDREQSHECPECGHENEMTFPSEGDGDYVMHECDDCNYEYEYEYYYE